MKQHLPDSWSLTLGGYYPACHQVYFLVALPESSRSSFVHLAIVGLPARHWNVRSRQQGSDPHCTPVPCTDPPALMEDLGWAVMGPRHETEHRPAETEVQGHGQQDGKLKGSLHICSRNIKL